MMEIDPVCTLQTKSDLAQGAAQHDQSQQRIFAGSPMHFPDECCNLATDVTSKSLMRRDPFAPIAGHILHNAAKLTPYCKLIALQRKSSASRRLDHD
jgi:hypothetical protein